MLDSADGWVAINAAYLRPGCFNGLWLDGMGAQQLSDYPAARDGAETFDRALNAAVLKMSELHRPPMMIVSSGLHDFERRTQQGYVPLQGRPRPCG